MAESNNTVTVDTPSRNADGSWSPEFLLSDARANFRAAASTYKTACRHLRIAIGDLRSVAQGDTVTAVAERRAKSDPFIARLLDDVYATRQKVADTAVALAELDPDFDISPLFPARG